MLAFGIKVWAKSIRCEQSLGKINTVLQPTSSEATVHCSTVSQTFCSQRCSSHYSFLPFAVYSQSPGAFGSIKVRPSASLMTFTFEMPLPVILPCNHWNQPGWLSTGEMVTLPAGTGTIKFTSAAFASVLSNSWNVSDASACSIDM